MDMTADKLVKVNTLNRDKSRKNRHATICMGWHAPFTF